MNVMKKNKLAGKFSLLHRLNTDTVIIGLLPGINVNELTSTDLRYLAAFYLGGAVYRNSMVTGKIFKDYCGPSKYPIGNYAKVLQVTAKKYRDHIIVDIPEISKHCWFENDFNMDCVYPEYNFQE